MKISAARIAHTLVWENLPAAEAVLAFAAGGEVTGAYHPWMLLGLAQRGIHSSSEFKKALEKAYNQALDIGEEEEDWKGPYPKEIELYQDGWYSSGWGRTEVQIRFCRAGLADVRVTGNDLVSAQEFEDHDRVKAVKGVLGEPKEELEEPPIRSTPNKWGWKLK